MYRLAAITSLRAMRASPRCASASLAAAGSASAVAVSATQSIIAGACRASAIGVFASGRRGFASAAGTTFFTKEHEYARLDGKSSSTATVGITTFAQSQLGEVVYVQLPNVGDSFTKGQAIATVESVKATSDVYAPLSGKVTAVNKSIVDDPALVNASPEDRAWFVKLELTAASETAQLLDAASYKTHCETAAEHH